MKLFFSFLSSQFSDILHELSDQWNGYTDSKWTHRTKLELSGKYTLLMRKTQQENQWSSDWCDNETDTLSSTFHDKTFSHPCRWHQYKGKSLSSDPYQLYLLLNTWLVQTFAIFLSLPRHPTSNGFLLCYEMLNFLLVSYLHGIPTPSSNSEKV